MLTHNAAEKRATLKLSTQQQDIFHLADPQNICPVPNKWGKQGWTAVLLTTIEEQLFAEVLVEAYKEVAPGNLNESGLNC